MEKEEIIEKIDEFVNNWRDHFYHNIDGSEKEADEMLKEWEELKGQL